MMDYKLDINAGPGWEVCQLIDLGEGKNAIVDGPFGSNLKTSDYIDDKVNGVPVLTTKNLKGDYSEDSVRYISKQKYEELKRSEVKPGDVIVAKIGSIGKTGIYPINRPNAIIPANLLKFSITKEVVFNYVYCYLNYEGFQKFIRLIATATAQPAFNVTKFRKLPIPLAPLPEQRAIVAKIDKLFSDLDNGIANLKTAKAKLDIYRQALLKKAFEGELTKAWRNKQTGLSKGWKYVRLGDITTLNPRIKDKGTINDDLIVQFLPMKFVEEIIDKIHLVETRKFNEVQKKSYTYFEEGDVLFAKVTPCMENGKIAVARNLKNGIGYGSSEFHIFRCSESLINKYLFYFLVQTKFRKDAQHAMTGAVGLRRVPKSFLEESLIPLPSLEEQTAIVAAIESRLTVCDKLAESIDQSLEKSEALRQSILKKAFAGKLLSEAELTACRREPEWEPAHKLLERVQKEKSGRSVKKQVKNR